MNKITYNILTFTIGGLVVFGALVSPGLSLAQGINAYIVIAGLAVVATIISRKTKKENELLWE